MDAYKQKLKEYITQQQQSGIPAENIRSALVQHGWDGAMVDEVISELTPRQSTGVSLPEPVAGFGQYTASQPVHTQPDSQYVGAQHVAAGSSQSQPSQSLAAADQQISADVIPKATPKYKLITAIGDSMRSIKRNFKAFAAVALISASVVVAIIISIGFLITGTILLKILNSDIPALFVLITTLGLVFLAYILTMIAMTFVQIVTTMAINEGAEGRRTSIKAIMHAGMQRIVKVIITNVLIGLIAVGPLLVVSSIVLTLAFSARGSGGGGSLVGMILLNMAAIVWIFIALFRYILASQIAMLEPDATPKQCLSRSRHLLKGGGRWFIFKGTMLLFVIVIIAAAISGQDINELESTRNPILNVFLIVIEVIANGVLVMLYRNRKLVKDSPAQQLSGTQ